MYSFCTLCYCIHMWRLERVWFLCELEHTALLMLLEFTVFLGAKHVCISKHSPPVSKLGGQLLCCTARCLPVSAQMCVPVTGIWCQAMWSSSHTERNARCVVCVSAENSQRRGISVHTQYICGWFLCIVCAMLWNYELIRIFFIFFWKSWCVVMKSLNDSYVVVLCSSPVLQVLIK